MSAGSVYALLADGATVEIWQAAGSDFESVVQMHRAMSPDNSCFRFFSMSASLAEREGRRVCREPTADHVALLAWLAGDLVGVAGYEAGGKPGTAEIAFAVADRAHHRGVATLLLEHLVAAARGRGVQAFTASVLPVAIVSNAGGTGLLACYGITAVPTRPVRSEKAPVDAAARLGGPVVLKADVAGLAHKTDAGAVQLDLHGGREVRAGYRKLAEKFGARMSAALIQPMIIGGTEMTIGVAQGPVFGPLVVFGLAGAATDVFGDRSARLTPLTDTDAEALIRSIRSAPLLLRRHGAPPADLAALRDILLRVSRLADDLPHVAELDLSPGHRPPGRRARGKRAGPLQPAQPTDPYLRKLR